MQLLSTLSDRLTAAGRQQEIIPALSDPALLHKSLREFGLS